MKKLLLALMILGLGTSVAMAQNSAVSKKSATKATAAKTTEYKYVTGKVDAITLADAAKGTKAEISVTEESGKKVTFMVKTSATVHDAAGVVTTLDKVKKDDKVKVKYSSKEGVNEAVTVKLIL
jgi:hypothetical protein